MAISVTPASRPSRVRCVNQVAATVSKSTKNNQPRAGKGLAFHAKTARQSMMAATMAAHHTGTWGMSGISTKAITTSRNKVSLLSRGKSISFCIIGGHLVMECAL